MLLIHVGDGTNGVVNARAAVNADAEDVDGRRDVVNVAKDPAMCMAANKTAWLLLLILLSVYK